MTKGAKRFNELKADYVKDYERTSGQKLKKIFYKDGYVHIDSHMMTHKHKISKFEEMCVTLSLRKDFKPKENNKVAKLVSVILITRVIVDKDASEDEIIEAARPGFLAKVKDSALGENLEKIRNDKECPYDPEYDKGEN